MSSLLSFKEAVLATYGVVSAILFVHYASMPLKPPVENPTELDDLKQAVAVTIETCLLGGIAYDNLMLSLGRMIRKGKGTAVKERKSSKPKKWQPDLLRLLSWPRFFLHSAVLPFNFLSLAIIGQREGVIWLSDNSVIVAIGIASAALSAYGIYESFYLKLILSEKGIIRYRIDGPGAFVGVAVAIGVTIFAILVGGSIAWMHPRDRSVLYGGIAMLLLASLPEPLALITANLGEIIFITTQIGALVEIHA